MMRNTVMLQIIFICNLVINSALATEQEALKRNLLWDGHTELSEYSLPTRVEQIEFSELNISNPRLDGRRNLLTIGFGKRIDEAVIDSTLTLVVRVSPLLGDNMSQLLVSLNGETVAARRINRGPDDEIQRLNISLPARYFSHYNELTFELLAELPFGRCPLNSPNAWVELSGASKLSISKQQLRLDDELAFFPEPFFDRRDFNPVDLHLISAVTPSSERLEAMSIIASQFGVFANWRGLDIHYHNLEQQELQLPEAHSILFATRQELIERGFDEDKNDASIIITDNPQHPAYKLLIISGKTESELKQVAQALAVLDNTFSGAHATIQAREISSRPAYMAPRWLSTQRKVEFGELVDHPSELERRGYHPEPVNINLRLPPDLFTWQRYGIPLDLRFRYTPPAQLDESRLRVSINNQFVKSFPLDGKGSQSNSERVRVPLVSSLTEASRFQLPSFQLSTVNNLALEYSFQTHLGECSTEPARSTTGVIDASSTIDLRGYQHYIAMPDLHVFAKAGYPFTKYDDLSQTVIVLGSPQNQEEIVTLLSVVAQMSASTGHPATHLEVTFTNTFVAPTDKDVLLLGHKSFSSFIERFGDRQLRAQVGNARLTTRPGELLDTHALFFHPGNMGMILGFESPFAASRSVIAITAGDNAKLKRTREVLMSNELNDQVEGFLTVVTPSRVESLQPSAPYYIGQLRWWKRWTYHIAQHPVLVAFFALVAVVLVTMLIFLILARVAKRREEGNA